MGNSFPSKEPSAVKIGLQTVFANRAIVFKNSDGSRGEFHNREVKQFLDSAGVKRFSTYNEETKASVFEAFQ